MNVMLAEDYTIKLIDFGDAKKINEKIEQDDDFYEETAGTESLYSK